MIRHKWQRLVIGQSQFIDAVMPALKRHGAGLCDPDRPVGVWLLAGPTGTGKTKSVQALAETLHGSPATMIRVDCGEFQMEHEVAKLVGAPPGYLGHRETQPAFTQLKLNAVSSEKSALSIVLLDELEKAHAALHRILLGIMDNGRLRLGDNTYVNFANTMIFATTNLAADKISRAALPPLGFAGVARPAVEAGAAIPTPALSNRAARNTFAPEFLNRIDGIIQFAPLTRDSGRQIAEIELGRAAARATTFALDIDPGVAEAIVAEGYSAEYGAREIKRAVERLVMSPVAELVCDLDKNGLVVRVGLGDGEVVIEHEYREASVSTPTPKPAARRAAR